MSPKQNTEQTGKQLKITLKRSLIGQMESQRRVAWALGLKKTHRSVIQPDTAIIRGMVNKIPHLLNVEELAS